MLERFAPGARIDGFVVGECIHAGGNAFIYRVTPPPDRDPGFPVVLKAPAIGRAQPTLAIVSFEMEEMIQPLLTGNHVPRFVAAGDLSATPYLAMEWVEGEALTSIIARAPLPLDDIVRIGAALADAVSSVHAQEVVHLDLKPENFILRPNGEAVLLDFGFAHHARYPDLLAEEQHFAAGSAPYVSPEQLRNDRSDPRSDLFALGVLLYELATGIQPFGAPTTFAGMRDRLWRAPPPPRSVDAQMPPWLQEVILRCLEPLADARYQSAAHLAFDLRHPDQVPLTDRAARTEDVGVLAQVGRWWRRSGKERRTRKRHRDGTWNMCCDCGSGSSHSSCPPPGFRSMSSSRQAPATRCWNSRARTMSTSLCWARRGRSRKSSHGCAPLRRMSPRTHNAASMWCA